jgi:hypothetical protein
MTQSLFVLLVLGVTACGSDAAGPAAANGGSSGSQGCPDVSGTWKLTKHCDASLVGMSLTVTERDCALTFAAPFDSFMGSVSAAGGITLRGPQSCTGTATEDAISMVCSPGTCAVVLAR